MPANCNEGQAPRPNDRPDRRASWLAAPIIAVATCLAYANTLHAPFIFDDVPSIVDNPTIRRLGSIGDVPSPPATGGLTVSGRPVLNLSLAINYAISGLDVWSYHAANLGIHVLAGLTLFGLVRRTLARPASRSLLAGDASPHSPATRLLPSDAFPLAIALLWTLHPLQTESVTYIIQRAESLMGLFFLLTLYAFVRAVDSSHPRTWHMISFLSCLLGAATKEVTALAPIMVFLYDRTFVSGTFRAAWRRHRWHHLALALTWLPLAWLLAGTGGNRGGTVGFDVGVSWSSYWLTQFEAVTRYLLLSFWPHPLIFDYGKVAPGGAGTVFLWAVPVVILAAGTLLALWRWPVAGFCGAWFWGILAPTSIVPGAIQMIVEHRMYLPLAAVITLIAGFGVTRMSRLAFCTCSAITALLAGTATFHRNTDYRSLQAMWEVTVRDRPTNARAHNNLGRILYDQGRWDEALERFRESRRLDPSVALTHYNIGLALIPTGQLTDAENAFIDALRTFPEFLAARIELGIVLTRLGRGEDALAHFAAAVRLDSKSADAHFQRGATLNQLGRKEDAASAYAEAVRLDPTYAQARRNWGVALFENGRTEAAIEQLATAVRLQPDLGDAHFNLGLVFASQGRLVEAATHYTEAVRLLPEFPDARLNLGVTLGQLGMLAEAIKELEKATGLRPEYAEAYYNLGYALFTAGRMVEARARLEEAIRLRPDDMAARELLRQLP